MGTEKENSTIAKIKKRNVIRVITLNDPLSFFLYKGTPKGFHYELSKRYAKSLGVELDLQIAPNYASAVDELKKGTCDLIAMNVKSKANSRGLDFSIPFFRSNPVLVQNKNNKEQYIKNWLDIKSMKIAISKDSPMKQTITNIESELGINIDIMFYNKTSQEQMINLVAKHEIPATLADKKIASIAKTYYPQLDISTKAGLPHNISWAVSESARDLLNNINGWLAGFKETSRYKTLFIKYFRNRKSIRNNKTEFIASLNQLSPFDDLIKKEAKILGWDWRLLAAVIYTESCFHEDKESTSGAFGVMQLMPITAKHYGISEEASTKEQITVGRKLLQFLGKELKQRMKDTTDLKRFSLASYNAGLGHIQDARRLAIKKSVDQDKWSEIAPIMLQMSNPSYYNDPAVLHGRFRGQESVNYVNKITYIYKSYKALIP